jgi:hypothetical protein
MPNQFDEKRQVESVRILAMSHDQDWLHFAENTLRRTDEVEVLENLDGVNDRTSADGRKTIILVSSELVPSKVKDFHEFIDRAHAHKVCVLRAPKDNHHRINDKHLKDLGVDMEDRPENTKAFRRILKHVLS